MITLIRYEVLITNCFDVKLITIIFGKCFRVKKKKYYIDVIPRIKNPFNFSKPCEKNGSGK